MADVVVPSLFDSDFISACLSRENEFSKEELRQRHQWHLWQEELKISCPLLRDKSQKVFISALTHLSTLQADVIFELSSIGYIQKKIFLPELAIAWTHFWK